MRKVPESTADKDVKEVHYQKGYILSFRCTGCVVARSNVPVSQAGVTEENGTIEFSRRKTAVGQYHRCQCTGDHHTGELQNRATCRGLHTTNYKGISRYSRVKRSLTASRSTPRDVSYAQAVQGRAFTRCAVTPASIWQPAGKVHDDAG